jgi:hypothetical protein
MCAGAVAGLIVGGEGAANGAGATAGAGFVAAEPPSRPRLKRKRAPMRRPLLFRTSAVVGGRFDLDGLQGDTIRVGRAIEISQFGRRAARKRWSSTEIMRPCECERPTRVGRLGPLPRTFNPQPMEFHHVGQIGCGCRIRGLCRSGCELMAHVALRRADVRPVEGPRRASRQPRINESNWGAAVTLPLHPRRLRGDRRHAAVRLDRLRALPRRRRPAAG